MREKGDSGKLIKRHGEKHERHRVGSGKHEDGYGDGRRYNYDRHQMDMDIDMDLKSGESHAKGAVDMKMMGTNVGTEIEMYTVKEKISILCIRWRTISGKEEMDDSAADMAGELSGSYRKYGRTRKIF